METKFGLLIIAAILTIGTAYARQTPMLDEPAIMGEEQAVETLPFGCYLKDSGQKICYDTEEADVQTEEEAEPTIVPPTPTPAPIIHGYGSGEKRELLDTKGITIDDYLGLDENQKAKADKLAYDLFRKQISEDNGIDSYSDRIRWATKLVLAS